MPRQNSVTSYSDTTSIYVEANDNDKTLEAATVGLDLRFVRLLKQQSKQNAFTLSKYLFAMNSEINDHYMRNIKCPAYYHNMLGV